MTKQHFEEDFFELRKQGKKEKKLASKRDRSKYKKTDFEKRQKLLQEQAEIKLSKKKLLTGRVLAIFPEEISVDCHGVIYSCVLRGVLKKEIGHIKNLLVVGDFVLFDPEEGSISHVEERKTVLARKEHLDKRKQQLIAANIDQVLITASVAEPSLKPSLIDRYLIATKKGGMTPVIIINKIDLLDKLSVSDQMDFEVFLKTYQQFKIPLILVSAKDSTGLDQLKKQMQGRASVFSGQSGVGKSSLINAVTGLGLPVGPVVKKTEKGAHVTTRAHLIPLAFGGWCIDTPGIRSFGVWDLKKEDLDDHFWEIKEVGKRCKYPNCTHTHEPECAVLIAIQTGEIATLRYDSYKKLLEEMTE